MNIVELLLSNSADQNIAANGFTPLRAACLLNDVRTKPYKETIKLLLQYEEKGKIEAMRDDKAAPEGQQQQSNLALAPALAPAAEPPKQGTMNRKEKATESLEYKQSALNRDL